MNINVTFTNNMQRKRKYDDILQHVMRKKILYIMILIPIAHLLVFSYLPMYGVVMAFKNFRYADGILGSSWNNFDHFKRLFGDPFFSRVFFNTLKISFMRILTGFPAPIIFALLLNEIRTADKFKKIVQTISYLPHFMSWVVIAGLFSNILSPQVGALNYILKTIFNIEPIYFMTNKMFFVPILLTTGIWAGVGYGAVIYLASIASIDVSLYEAAEIDGATRLQRVVHITLPSITSIIIILFILGLGSILSAGFDQIFNFYNPLVYEVADIIDTYTYRIGMLDGRYDYAAAVGLFKNVVGFLLVYLSNRAIKGFSEHGIW